VSIEAECTLEGFEEFRAAMERFDSNMQTQVQGQLRNWAEEVKTSAKQLVPVKTGHLQSSIYAAIHEWVAEIGAEATYALFVELGTRRMQARPYLYPAIQEHLPELERVVLDALDAAKSEAGLE
jgi:HK97 gp10 family phage protein